MTTKKYRFLAHEVDGIEQSFPQELDFSSSDMLLGVRGLVTVPTIQATAAVTTTFTATSDTAQVFTGTTAGQIVQLPDATTLSLGHRFELYNQSSQSISVKDGAGGSLFSLSQTSVGYIILQNNSTASGGWIFWQVFISSLASGILNYNIVSSTPFSTSVRTPTYVGITGLSVTPQAGTYAVWYNASVYYTTTPKAHYWRIAKGGVAIADSLRRQDTAHSNQTMVDSTMTVAAFNGSQQCSVEVSCDNTGTLTVNARTLLLIRLGG